MEITKQNHQIWKNLFKSAIAFRDLKPWEWMTNNDIFGVKDPNSDLVGYCCIMGNGQQVYGLGVYLGDQGFDSYLQLATVDEIEDGELDRLNNGLNQYLLKIEFVDNKEMDKVDKAALKELGLKPRGKNQWIQIREMTPGHFPWYLSDEQALFLTHVIWQAIDVAERAKENPAILFNENLELSTILVRIPEKEGTSIVWKDEDLEEPEWDESDRVISDLLIHNVQKSLKIKKAALCFSLFYMPSPIREGKGRPYFGKIAVWIAYGSGFVMGFEILKPDDNIAKIDEAFINQFKTIGFIPSQIIINTEMAEDAVFPLTEALGIELVYAPEEKEFEAAHAVFHNRF